MNSEWIRAIVPTASPALRRLVAIGMWCCLVAAHAIFTCLCAGMVMTPAAIGIGWVIRAREHDSLVRP